MNADHEENGTDIPKVVRTISGRPIGGVSLFGANSGLLGDLKARFRKSLSSEDDPTETGSPEQSPIASSPIKLNPVITERSPSPEKNNRSRTASNSTQEETDKLLPNLTGRRARKPSTRLPSFYLKYNAPSSEISDLSTDPGESEILDIFFKTPDLMEGPSAPPVPPKPKWLSSSLPSPTQPSTPLEEAPVEDYKPE